MANLEALFTPSSQDASIPVHMENICSRNYVHVDSGRRLVPTKLGIVLVHGYQKVRNCFSTFPHLPAIVLMP